MPRRLLVVYHSASGTTRHLLEATLEVRKALKATAEDVVAADALLLGTRHSFLRVSAKRRIFNLDVEVDSLYAAYTFAKYGGWRQQQIGDFRFRANFLSGSCSRYIDCS